MRIVTQGERILLTLWVGSLWAIGYIAVPTLFAVLNDRQLAGNLAGQMFQIVSYIGLVCGSLLLLSQLRNYRLQWRSWLLIIMLVAVACGEFVLQPMMATLKAQGLLDNPDIKHQFGILHGVASILYLAESLSGLVLVMVGLHDVKEQGNG